MKAVRFDHYGDFDVLDVVEVPDPVAGTGEVLVRVKAAGINPGEAAIRNGARPSRRGSRAGGWRRSPRTTAEAGQWSSGAVVSIRVETRNVYPARSTSSSRARRARTSRLPWRTPCDWAERSAPASVGSA
jgi:hypothetical protein